MWACSTDVAACCFPTMLARAACWCCTALFAFRSSAARASARVARDGDTEACRPPTARQARAAQPSTAMASTALDAEGAWLRDLPTTSWGLTMICQRMLCQCQESQQPSTDVLLKRCMRALSFTT